VVCLAAGGGCRLGWRLRLPLGCRLVPWLLLLCVCVCVCVCVRASACPTPPHICLVHPVPTRTTPVPFHLLLPSHIHLPLLQFTKDASGQLVVLGEGGFAVVYRALLGQQPVAVKVRGAAGANGAGGGEEAFISPTTVSGSREGRGWEDGRVLLPCGGSFGGVQLPVGWLQRPASWGKAGPSTTTIPPSLTRSRLQKRILPAKIVYLTSVSKRYKPSAMF
jgi:hypothetical protein